MSRLSNLSPAEKRTAAGLALWFIAGIGMVAVGLIAVLSSRKTLDAVSGFLGVCSVLTGAATLIVRLSQIRRLGRGNIGLDIFIWFFLGVLLLHTEFLQKLGKLAFTAVGIAMLCEGIRAFIAAGKNKTERGWYIPRVIFSAAFVIMGIIVILNAERIFRGMTALSIGIFLIIHGTQILSEGIGRTKYFFNFRGT